MYESGVFGARPQRLPLSIGDPTLVTGATAITSMFELFAFYLQAGLIDVAFLGGAQIDRLGNLNTTVIGDYADPKVRLPGSGGACEIAIHARRILVIMRQAQRSFVRAARLPHLAGTQRRPDPRRRPRLVGQRAHERRDRPRHVRVRRVDRRDDPRYAAPRDHARGRPFEHGVGAEESHRTWGRRCRRPMRSSGSSARSLTRAACTRGEGEPRLPDRKRKPRPHEEPAPPVGVGGARRARARLGRGDPRRPQGEGRAPEGDLRHLRGPPRRGGPTIAPRRTTGSSGDEPRLPTRAGSHPAQGRLGGGGLDHRCAGAALPGRRRGRDRRERRPRGARRDRGGRGATPHARSTSTGRCSRPRRWRPTQRRSRRCCRCTTRGSTR